MSLAERRARLLAHLNLANELSQLKRTTQRVEIIILMWVREQLQCSCTNRVARAHYLNIPYIIASNTCDLLLWITYTNYCQEWGCRSDCPNPNKSSFCSLTRIKMIISTRCVVRLNIFYIMISLFSRGRRASIISVPRCTLEKLHAWMYYMSM